MARKNLLDIVGHEAAEEELPAGNSEPVLRDHRPLAGFSPPPRAAATGMSKTLGEITRQIERSEEFERQLTEGLAVVEIDPESVVSAFVRDRLEIDPKLGGLVEQIREHGQQVPILVRPYPKDRALYQIAYGHRRHAAAKLLGRKVKAVVRELTDDELVVSQGQENNVRADLSYIERCLFAARLEDGGFTRDIIMASLGVDKTNVSRMIALAHQIPAEVIFKIGAAPAVGRRRWSELADKLPAGNLSEEVFAILDDDHFRALSSDERFDAFLASMTSDQPRETTPWQRFDDALPVKFKRSGSGTTFVFSEKEAPGFDEFVKSRLSNLYAEYRKQTGD
ncbi:plasmid partitioning protein RepB (plasmid) [Rhizobium sp. CB3171]|uniref:plasmid partitioning protein RepB n=1 Tax=Rhizobium sp. CB3171 TaxID=3039157 RepID=UPI0024B195E8|nr:plasmid partitioning protein RepB [Rhizobium sp. CB3171]WFU07203.1 plasmid partitioning protein RepB [Rhizobium sp. CB3171]